MATLEQLGSEKYVLLTTFRKDGSPVGTPVWVLPDGTGVAIWTESRSYKVKRVRNNPRVTVAACDFRGNVRGETVEGTARIVGDAERDRFAKVLGRKYYVTGILGSLRYRLLGHRDRITVIAVAPAQGSATGAP
ncbi:PPOX class F420-dependent oxidoreductase [Actinoplanes sp. M2I2]|uniref:PPOX class F420-dependent oxidoreductase n=1 Tax=Actinoplanes sp. M2I2 TaxID=1734444 RepID=UPI002020D42E|nr:PPOX class F420-dependent oxidoreductase [Actinoplanes sp. M2I2]